MKKSVSIPVIILFAFILAISSCKKEESLDKLIIGKWKVQSITQVYYENNVKISEYTLYSLEDDMTIQFADGGTGVIYQGSDIFGAFTWSLSGNTITLDTGSSELTEWTVTVDGDIIVWSFEESEIVENVTQKYEYLYTAGRVN